MRYFVFFAIYVLYSVVRQAIKKSQQAAKLRNAELNAKAADEFGTMTGIEPGIVPQSALELQSNVPGKSTIDRNFSRRSKPRKTKKQIESYDVERYTEAPLEGGAGFVLNEGFSKRERFDLNAAFDVETARLSAVKIKVEFTPKALREFFVMREVLGAPRARDPFRARKAYYDPRDLSRD